MSGMYWEYAKERLGAEVIQKEYGFALLILESDSCLIIQDFYIKPEHRNYKTTKQFFNEIETLAKEFGMQYLVTTIDPATVGATKALKLNLHCGFELISCENELIYLRKVI